MAGFHYIKKWFTHFDLLLTHGPKLSITQCRELKTNRSDTRIQGGSTRSTTITRDEAYAIVEEAIRSGDTYVAMSLLIRFWFNLRGGDVDGE